MAYIGYTAVVTTGASSANAVRATYSSIAASGQTTFSVSGGFTAGAVDVFQNGAKLQRGSDFTDTSGVNVVLAIGASESDLIEIVKYNNMPSSYDTYTRAESDSKYPGNAKVFATNIVFGT